MCIRVSLSVLKSLSLSLFLSLSVLSLSLSVSQLDHSLHLTLPPPNHPPLSFVVDSSPLPLPSFPPWIFFLLDPPPIFPLPPPQPQFPLIVPGASPSGSCTTPTASWMLASPLPLPYGVAMISWLHTLLGLFWKRALFWRVGKNILHHTIVLILSMP